MGSEYRHELKFLCSEQELRLIESRIRHICRKDAHAGEDGVYHIRSMYFDTPNNEFYYENEAGTDPRHKYRIRIYNGNDGIIKLERKSTAHGMKKKDVCTITKEQCECLLENRAVSDCEDNQKVLAEFLTERQMKLLTPKVIVEYVRTPYVYPVGNVRITFDRNISSAANKKFLEKNIPLRAIMPEGMHVLEVKYDEILPYAILELIDSEHRLRRTSFSKYALCRKFSNQS